MDCNYSIPIPNGMAMEINFNGFEVEYHRYCGQVIYGIRVVKLSKMFVVPCMYIEYMQCLNKLISRGTHKVL